MHSLAMLFMWTVLDSGRPENQKLVFHNFSQENNRTLEPCKKGQMVLFGRNLGRGYPLVVYFWKFVFEIDFDIRKKFQKKSIAQRVLLRVSEKLRPCTLYPNFRNCRCFNNFVYFFWKKVRSIFWKLCAFWTPNGAPTEDVAILLTLIWFGTASGGGHL